MNKKRVILYFGSFNPIHTGHLTIADFIVDSGLCDEVWFVVSPNNPLKKQDDLLDDRHRLEMARLAVDEWNSRIKVSDVEFQLSKPSYTINTIRTLTKEYPDIEFSLLLGEDNIFFFDRWKKWTEIATMVTILIYPRRTDARKMVRDKINELCQESSLKSNRFCYLSEAPLIDMSSTYIRARMDGGEPIESCTAQNVVDYIKKNELYGR